MSSPPTSTPSSEEHEQARGADEVSPQQQQDPQRQTQRKRKQEGRTKSSRTLPSSNETSDETSPENSSEAKPQPSQPPQSPPVISSLDSERTPTRVPSSSKTSPKRKPSYPSTGPPSSQKEEEWNVTDALEEKIGKPGREALHKFFYPPSNRSTGPMSTRQQQESPRPPIRKSSGPSKEESAGSATTMSQGGRQGETRAQSKRSLGNRSSSVPDPQSPLPTNGTQNQATLTSSPTPNAGQTAEHQTGPATAPSPSPISPPPNNRRQVEFDDHFRQQEQDDRKFVSDFWHIYDDLLILSLFTQLGIVARLGSSLWFSFFDNVFSNESALFVNLPLNSLSCFLLGMLCSGESCMEIITTRFSPPKLQQQIHTDKIADPSEEDDMQNKSQDRNPEEQHTRTPTSNDLGRAGPIIGRPDSPPDSPAVGIRRHPSDDSMDVHPNSNFDGDMVWSRFGNQHRGLFRRRGRGGEGAHRSKYDKNPQRFLPRSWQPPVALNEELRDVQLLALERRIRQSKCLLLFPVHKEDVDVMEHYFDEGYKKRGERQSQGAVGEPLFDDEDMDGLFLQETHDDDEDVEVQAPGPAVQRLSVVTEKKSAAPRQPQPPPETLSSTTGLNGVDPLQSSATSTATDPPQTPQTPHTHGTSETPHVVELHGEANPTDLNQIVHEVSANVTENISRLRRVNLANGWDVGTTAEDMSDDLMLGLRFGFCGALSSFSSWNSAMINLIRSGKIVEAFVGYMLGVQLPIMAYRFGQHLAVYIFVWRCRQETKRDERRGYGIQLNTHEDDDDDNVIEMNGQDLNNNDDNIDTEADAPGGVTQNNHRNKETSTETPSIRAIITVLFIMAVVTQCTSISFYSEPQNQVVALSLLFSPLGVLARWRLSKYNEWRPTFPIGTFTCNMLACALSGGLGRLLGGNPNEEERLVLQSLINGFGGTLSSVANFIVEILAGMDPILFRFDGVIYALWSILCAMVVGFVFTASADWADDTG